MRNPSPRFTDYELNTGGREDTFYIKDTDNKNVSSAFKTRHAAEKVAERLNKPEERERYYVLGIEYHKNPELTFHEGIIRSAERDLGELEIGEMVDLLLDNDNEIEPAEARRIARNYRWKMNRD